jgi:hypothetical protein
MNEHFCKRQQKICRKKDEEEGFHGQKEEVTSFT